MQATDEYIKRKDAQRLFADRHDYGLARELDAIPAADVAPVVHGHWIHRKNWGKWVCSACSSEEDRPRKRCPECGAKMRGDGNI